MYIYTPQYRRDPGDTSALLALFIGGGDFPKGREDARVQPPLPGAAAGRAAPLQPREGGGDRSGRGTLTGAPEQRVPGKGRGRKAEYLCSMGGVVQTPVVGRAQAHAWVLQAPEPVRQLPPHEAQREVSSLKDELLFFLLLPHQCFVCLIFSLHD